MNELLEGAAEVADQVIALRRDLHQHPELGLENPRTQQKIVEALAGLPLTVSTGTGLTSVVAELEGEHDGPTVLLRADTDALPMTEDTDEAFCSTEAGRAHACGHDAHTAMLVGPLVCWPTAAKILKAGCASCFSPAKRGAAGHRS